MTDPSIPWSQWQDPRALLANLDRQAAEFAARGRRVDAAMAAATAEVTEHGVRMTVLGGRLTQLQLEAELAGAGATHARERVLAGWRDAVVAANRGGAAALASLADLPGGEAIVAGWRASLPSGTEEAAERYDRTTPPAEAEAQAPPAAEAVAPSDDTPAPTAMTRAALDELLAASDDDDDPISLADLARELDFEANRVPGDPSQWQANLEEQVRRISEAAKDLPALMAATVGTAEGRLVSITVNAAGGLVDLRFTTGALGRLDELNAEITTVLAAAQRDAEERLDAALAEHGWDSPAEDPTLDLFRGRVEQP